jgi:RNA polymerase sigma-70 factor (ECF subfamily)
LHAVLHHIQKLAGVQAAAALPDGDLLGRFVGQRDEAAFTALVERHGPMVLGVCRRVLRHAHDAEDACQAAFLVLARKAASIRKKDALASWLYGVAYHVATNLRRDLARRGGREAPLADTAAPDPAGEVTWREVQAVLDKELARLPEKYRAPLVLCYLEGKTRDEAAQLLGWSVGSFRGRLERGRELLRARLTRCGLGLSAALLANALGQAAAAAASPPTRVLATVKAASLLAAGRAAAEVISVQVAALIEGVLRHMVLTKLARLMTVVLGVALVVLGGGLLLQHRAAAHPGQAEKPPAAGNKGNAGTSRKEAIKKELKNLEGTWTLVSLERLGVKVPDEALKNWQLTIKGDQWTMKHPNGVNKVTVRIDLTKKPKTIDLTFQFPRRTIQVRGIYKLDSTTEGDTLTLCRVDNQALPRPKEFKTTKRAGLLYVWQRAK